MAAQSDRCDLFGLPLDIQFESPTSWISRGALSQGASVREMLKYLGIEKEKDTDLAFLRAFPRLWNRCGLSPDSFYVSRLLIESLERVDPQGERFLMRTDRGRPRYRVCPNCLAAQRTAFFPIHWRFDAWRYCPEHGCMMEDACWACESEIQMPCSLGIVGPQIGRCASLGQCAECAKFRSRGPVVRLTAEPSVFTQHEFDLLANGRAVLAALSQRRVVYPGCSNMRLGGLHQIDRMGMLPKQGVGPSSALWRARVAASQRFELRDAAVGAGSDQELFASSGGKIRDDGAA